MANRQERNSPKMGNKDRYDTEYKHFDGKRYKDKNRRKNDKRKFLDEDNYQKGKDND